MEDNSELIKKVYLFWKKGQVDHSLSHPDEETLACFIDGILPEQEQVYLKAHLLRCHRCAEKVAAQALLSESIGETAAEMVPLSIDQVEKLKSLLPVGADAAAEIVISWKMGVFRLLHYSEGFFLQRYAATGLCRGEKVGVPVRDITLRKNFSGIGVEIKVAGLDEQRFSLCVFIRAKMKQGGLDGLRAALFIKGKEIESRQFNKGCAVFSEVSAGDYLLEINAGSGKRLAVARLVLDTA